MYLVSRYLENNSDGDDALAVLEEGDVVWFCVSDGAGGSGYGAKASDFIVRSFVDCVQEGDLGEAHLFEAFLRDIDQTLFAQKHGGEATAIVGKIDGGTVMGASVGDSKAILYHSNYEFELT